MDDISARMECMRLADAYAHGTGVTIEKTVERAKAYADFVLGIETVAKQETTVSGIVEAVAAGKAAD